MLGTTIKRSAAALAVTAGLLAAAAPASHGATQTKAPVGASSFSWSESQTGTAAKGKQSKGKRGKAARANAATLENTLVSGYSVKAGDTVGQQGIIMRDGGVCDPIRHMGC